MKHVEQATGEQQVKLVTNQWLALSERFKRCSSSDKDILNGIGKEIGAASVGSIKALKEKIMREGLDILKKDVAAGNVISLDKYEGIVAKVSHWTGMSLENGTPLHKDLNQLTLKIVESVENECTTSSAQTFETMFNMLDGGSPEPTSAADAASQERSEHTDSHHREDAEGMRCDEDRDFSEERECYRERF